MATTSYKISDAVTEICKRMNDPNLTKYAVSDYTGRALDKFYEAIEEMIDNNTRYSLNPYRDYPGLIGSEEVKIGGASDENGEYDLSELTNYQELLRDPYVNPDSDNDQLPYTIKKISKYYPEYYTHNENSSDVFFTPIIDTDTERGYYEDGFKLYFFPKSGTGEQDYYVTLEYLKFLDIDNYDKDTELLYTLEEKGGLFSWKFIRKAERMATDLLLEERNKR